MQPVTEKIWIIGAGAIGSAIAAVLFVEKRGAVCLVGQSRQARAVKDKGMAFEAADKTIEGLPIRVASPDEVPALSEGDLVLVTQKTYQLEHTAVWLKERCHSRTGVITLQNGIGPEQILQRCLGRPVDRGLAFFGANASSPGRVRYFPGRILLRRSPVTESFSALMRGSQLPCEISVDFKETEWQKLAINCIANPISGILKISNRGIVAPVLDTAKSVILNEVRSVARAEGIDLATQTADINRILNQDNIPSLRTDLERKLTTEIDALNGAVVRLGKKHGIPTPANSLLVSMVKCLEQMNIGSSSETAGDTEREQ